MKTKPKPKKVKLNPKPAANPTFVPNAAEIHALEAIAGAGAGATEQTIKASSQIASAFHEACSRVKLNNREMMIAAWAVILKLTEERDEFVKQRRADREAQSANNPSAVQNQPNPKV